MPPAAPRSWLNNTRGVELMLSTLAIVWGVAILQPTGFDLPAYEALKELMRGTLWGALAVCIGVLRLLFLGINGWWRRSPFFRAIGTLLSGLFWMCVGVLMLAAARRHGADLPAGVLWYGVYFGFEGWCLVSAGYDMQKNGSLHARGR